MYDLVIDLTRIEKMLSKVVIWFLKVYFESIDSFKEMKNVLRIKFSKPLKEATKPEFTEPKGHLALRLNVTRELSSAELFELVEYVHNIFGVKYLTLIAGNRGFEREIDFNLNLNNQKLFACFYHNFEQVFIPTGSDSRISVNLIDNDSETLFLLKMKEHLSKSSEESVENISKKAMDCFTGTKMKETTLPIFYFRFCTD